MSNPKYTITLSKGTGTTNEIKARYLDQLYQLLATAQRMNNNRVIFALRKLINKRGRE